MKNKFVIILLFAFTSTFAQTEGGLSVSVQTSETGGKYSPRNVLAIWVENSSGDYIKTLLAYADKRKTHLNNWQKSTGDAGSEYNVTDAITGATQNSHSTRSCNWNGIDFKGDVANDGAYKLCFELTDKNETGNYTSISFNKNTEKLSITPPDESSFKSIQINWTPAQSSAIELNENIENYTVYPNPTEGLIQIEGKHVELIEISDIKGNLIYNGTNTKFNLVNHSNGIYLVRIKTTEGAIIKKIVKQ